MAQMQVFAQRVLTFLRSFYACSQKYKKVWHFLRKTLDICLRFGYNNTRRQGHGPRRKEYADVAELADALDSGSSSLKRVWVQIPSSAPKSSNVCSGIFLSEQKNTLLEKSRVSGRVCGQHHALHGAADETVNGME